MSALGEPIKLVCTQVNTETGSVHKPMTIVFDSEIGTINGFHNQEKEIDAPGDFTVYLVREAYIGWEDYRDYNFRSRFLVSRLDGSITSVSSGIKYTGSCKQLKQQF